jgi:hypothetical protein
MSWSVSAVAVLSWVSEGSTTPPLSMSSWVDGIAHRVLPGLADIEQRRSYFVVAGIEAAGENCVAVMIRGELERLGRHLPSPRRFWFVSPSVVY